MSAFGDFELDDAFDTAPADPEQVARRLYELEGGVWDDLDEDERLYRLGLMLALLAWLRRSGALR